MNSVLNQTTSFRRKCGEKILLIAKLQPFTDIFWKKFITSRSEAFLEYIGVYTQHFERWLFEEEKAIFPPIYGI